jgi:ubiquinone/menaquinone biosynthesis C-methylase UbiE
MNNENKSIHDFDLQMICNFFSTMERQGPGSPEMTLKALGFVDHLTKNARIVDLGCGTGGQTMTLAQHIEANIIALDSFPDFIKILNRNAQGFNFQERVKGLVGSMDNLPFQENELDLIWSEGAIYNIGFERGLKEWRKYLKTGGYLAVSESSWFTDKRPAEINKYWMDAYPEIDTIPHQIAKIHQTGYLPVASFIFPENCWTEHYFAQKALAEETFLHQYAGNKMAEEFILSQRYEEELYAKYKAFYGYTFFIAKKIDL